MKAQIGNVHEIEWRLGRRYEDLIITEGTGLLFRWSGSYHNLLEMSSPVDSDCKFVDEDAFSMGQVKKCIQFESHKHIASMLWFMSQPGTKNVTLNLMLVHTMIKLLGYALK